MAKQINTKVTAPTPELSESTELNKAEQALALRNRLTMHRKNRKSHLKQSQGTSQKNSRSQSRIKYRQPEYL